ncbi:hypothetical protein BKA57DRAFT_228021 [Linnemannia elongata]|nr:hypothetical protein BKA57DRAFT_228021 [Linnemannia elongata]
MQLLNGVSLGEVPLRTKLRCVEAGSFFSILPMSEQIKTNTCHTLRVFFFCSPLFLETSRKEKKRKKMRSFSRGDRLFFFLLSCPLLLGSFTFFFSILLFLLFSFLSFPSYHHIRTHTSNNNKIQAFVQRTNFNHPSPISVRPSKTICRTNILEYLVTISAKQKWFENFSPPPHPLTNPSFLSHFLLPF